MKHLHSFSLCRYGFPRKPSVYSETQEVRLELHALNDRVGDVAGHSVCA